MSSADFLSESTFFGKFFQEYLQSGSGRPDLGPNSSYSDHTQHFVGTDLGPNCLKRVSAEDT